MIQAPKFKIGDLVRWDVYTSSGGYLVGTKNVFFYGKIAMIPTTFKNVFFYYKILRDDGFVSNVPENCLQLVKNPNEIIKEIL